jgi:hypothetical protein
VIPADRKAFIETVIGFAELKGKKLSVPALELYWRALQHWSLEDFRAAAEQLLRTCEFMPVPKDFEDLRKAARMTPGEAWAEVLACARQGGKSIGDSLTDRAVRAIGGYHAISMSNTEQTPFLERRFCTHYEAIRDSEEIREAVPQIVCDETSKPKLNGPTSAAALLARRLG